MFDDIDRKSIGAEIRKARKVLKLSQFELAEMTGIDEKQIYRIESGLSSPKLENFLKIAKALNLDIKYFNFVNLKNSPYMKETMELLTTMPDDKIKICYGVIKSLSENL